MADQPSNTEAPEKRANTEKSDKLELDIVELLRSAKDLRASSAAFSNSDKESDKGSAKESDKGSVKEPDKGSTKEPDKGSVKEPDKGSTKEPDKGSVKESDKGSVKESDKGSAKESDKGSVKESDKGSTKEPDKGSDKATDKGSSKGTEKSGGVLDIPNLLPFLSDSKFLNPKDTTTQLQKDSPFDKLLAAPEKLEMFQKLLGNMDKIQSMTLSKGNSGWLQFHVTQCEKDVYAPRSKGPVHSTFLHLGSEMSGNISPSTDGGIWVGGINGARATVYGPFDRPRGTGYLRDLHIAPNGVTTSYSDYFDKRPRFNRKDVDAQYNPAAAKFLSENPNAIKEATQFMEMARRAERIDVRQLGRGVTEVTITTNPADRKIELNQQFGIQTVKSLELGERVSLQLSQTEKGIKIDNIQGIKINSAIANKPLSVDLRGATIEPDNKGRVALNMKVSNPFDSKNDLIIPVSGIKRP